jgi:hypothetical protein
MLVKYEPVLSLVSVVGNAIRPRAARSGVQISARQQILLFKTHRQSLRPIQPPVSWSLSCRGVRLVGAFANQNTHIRP